MQFFSSDVRLQEIFFKIPPPRQELNDMITRLIDRVVAKQLVNITKCSASEVICIMQYSKP